jgi:cysteine synthase
MRMLGARVILTPAAERGTGMMRKAEELALRHGWFLARQFENQANPAYHRSTTGPEILSDFAGKRLDFFVTGWGTSGTLTGAGEMIRLARPDVKIIASEPEAAAMLSGRPWAPHKIQGWTPDLIPAVLNREVPHRIVPVTDVEAIGAARALARQEGIFWVAISISRASLWSSRTARSFPALTMTETESGSRLAWKAKTWCKTPLRACMVISRSPRRS